VSTKEWVGSSIYTAITISVSSVSDGLGRSKGCVCSLPLRQIG